MPKKINITVISALTILCLTMWFPVICRTQPTKTTEYKIKAAYLYNFAKFVQWPKSAFSSSKAPIYICILGTTPFEKELKNIEKKTIRQRTLLIKKYQSIDEIQKCHILYISI